MIYWTFFLLFSHPSLAYNPRVWPARCFGAVTLLEIPA